MNCLACRGACCEEPITKSDLQNDVMQFFERRWIRLHNTSTGACSALKNGQCEIYTTRPLICRAYPTGGVDCRSVIAQRRTREQYETIREAGDPLWAELSPAHDLAGVAGA